MGEQSGEVRAGSARSEERETRAGSLLSEAAVGRTADLLGRDIVLLVLDTLRYDVAQALHVEGRTPNLSRYLGPEGWERRHSPASFTYAAHHAFFAGFLPTPARPGKHPRLFAAAFEGSETTTEDTWVFAEATIPEALAARGYRTICAGGVGFFNQRTELGRVLPSLFETSRWCREFSVVDYESTRHQFEWVASELADEDRRAFVFVNVSAIHQPNCGYVPGKEADDLQSHAAALEYVDSQVPALFEALRVRSPRSAGEPPAPQKHAIEPPALQSRDAFVIVTSDHGTAYGEDGYFGHRCAHPVVWEVPYAHFVLES